MLEIYENLDLEDLVIDGVREIWKQVNSIEELSGFKDYYYVSNFGRVKSTNGNEKILRQGDNGRGYLYVCLQTLDGKPRNMYVHRLVGLVFVEGHSKERNQSNHINEVKTDNRASNLNWMSAKENANHGTAIKRSAEKRSMPVVGECVNTGEIIEFESTREAGRCGFNQGNVVSACRGEYAKDCKHGGTNVYRGFKWKYKAEDDV